MQVSKYSLNQKKLRSRYKQIVGFHFVSSVNMTGIQQLADELIRVTLEQKYMGEAFPV